MRSASVLSTETPRHAPAARQDLIVLLFVATTFTASALLFAVQPMFAKMALPRLGGSPSVWNTCVLFFQTALLLAYLYAHLSVKWLGARTQAIVHVFVLLAPLLVLPVSMPAGSLAPDSSPTWWLLQTMAVRVGLPFFVVATMAPLVQRWFATLPVKGATDPYFLYAASNFGSMLALLGFPFLLEPSLGVRSQATGWVWGYILLIGITALCAWTTWKHGTELSAASSIRPDDAAPSLSDRIWWILLALVPSSLMLGVTTHISTDVAAVPLLWVVPLSLYLGTFILAFSTRRLVPDWVLAKVLPLLALLAIASVLFRLSSTVWIGLHVLAFFAASWYCHRQLAVRRPSTLHLTEFYLWLSVGGVLGGVFNTLIAPHVFDGIHEYPLMLAAACALRAAAGRPPRSEPWPLFAVSSAIPLFIATGAWRLGAFPPGIGITLILVVVTIIIGTVWAFAQRRTPFNVVVLLLALFPVVGVGQVQGGDVKFADRSFFGVIKVIDNPTSGNRLLQHGTTMHGQQALRDLDGCKPLAYFHPSSPIGQFFRLTAPAPNDWLVIGLGTGALACYAAPGQRVTFFEIDPLMKAVAGDPQFFTFLSNAAVRTDVVIGDGRLLLDGIDSNSLDLLVLDAFSSDAVPVHLITREAFQAYLSRLRPNGVLAMHISNRFLNLEPVLASIAKAENLTGLANNHAKPPEGVDNTGWSLSHWVFVSRAPQNLDHLRGLPGWRSLDANPPASPWTDDYSNILDALFIGRRH